MKKLLLSVFCCLFILNLLAQQKPRYFTNTPLIFPIDYFSLYSPKGLSESKTVVIKSDTATEKLSNVVNERGELVTQTFKIYKKDTSFKVSKIARSGYAFNVIKKDVGNYVLIKYWPNNNDKNLKKTISYYEAFEQGANNSDDAFKSTPTETKNYSINSIKDNVNDTKDYYLIRKSDLETDSKEFEYKKNKWSLGITILPVKLRPFAKDSTFEFWDGFSVGTAFSYTHKHRWVNDKTFNWIIYTGISSITVDSVKTRGTTKSEKIAAFSPAIGYMIEKGGIQLSIFTGIDFPFGKVQRSWVYRWQPWIGLGIGFSIFKIQSSENKQEGEN